jgi:hypothetical protein
MDLLRCLRLGDSFRPITVTLTIPIVGLLTHQRRYWQCLGDPHTPYPAPERVQSIVETVLTAKRHQRIQGAALGICRRLCTKLPAT